MSLFFDDEFDEQAAKVSKAPAAIRVVSTFFSKDSPLFLGYFFKNKPIFFL